VAPAKHAQPRRNRHVKQNKQEKAAPKWKLCADALRGGAQEINCNDGVRAAEDAGSTSIYRQC